MAAFRTALARPHQTTVSKPRRLLGFHAGTDMLAQTLAALPLEVEFGL